MFFARLGLFFPGLLKHHSLNIKGAYEGQRPDNYHFESKLPFSRGYHYKFHEDICKGSINYKIPLLYPDFSLGPVFYLKRIKANLFYDLFQQVLDS